MTGSPCVVVNCNSTGGGGMCTEVGGGSSNYTCYGCSYGSSVLDGPCPESPCVTIDCNSTGGGGICTEVGGGSSNFTCSDCTYGSSVVNGACPG
ncbi:unnamed protein product [Rotaria sp. Silwood2]|nr:unnamed protein product [Rotaria sp. Silwood2]CAF3163247.1 unnamed protein product [Rotaria sp. Silwood2]CAF4032518.1 unnamed protein product [Rotaria sp. Silwood2]CAF4131960.1 unnamed protein product [Rotaria sp. Silwood2]